MEGIYDLENGVRIEPFYPEKGHCIECGSSEVKRGSDPVNFERDLTSYRSSKNELLEFYDHYVSLE